jgi:hypothetical protein
MEESRDAQDLKHRYPTVDFTKIIIYAYRMFHERKSGNCGGGSHEMCIDTEWYWCCEKHCECKCHRGAQVTPASQCPIQSPEDLLSDAAWKRGRKRPTVSRRIAK